MKKIHSNLHANSLCDDEGCNDAKIHRRAYYCILSLPNYREVTMCQTNLHRSTVSSSPPMKPTDTVSRSHSSRSVSLEDKMEPVKPLKGLFFRKSAEDVLIKVQSFQRLPSFDLEKNVKSPEKQT